MVFEGMDLLVFLWQLLFKWFCACVPPSDNQFGSLQEIERLESAWGMESPIPPPFTSFADTSTPVTSPPVSLWCCEQTPENRWGETSTAPKEKRLTRVEQSLLHMEPMWKSFAFWAASLWQLSCSFLSGFINFCDHWKFQTAQIFKSW